VHGRGGTKVLGGDEKLGWIGAQAAASNLPADDSAMNRVAGFTIMNDWSARDLQRAEMAVGLRAHTFANKSLDDQTVELINVVISDINGCKPWTQGHVEKSRQLGTAKATLPDSIQVPPPKPPTS